MIGAVSERFLSAELQEMEKDVTEEIEAAEVDVLEEIREITARLQRLEARVWDARVGDRRAALRRRRRRPCRQSRSLGPGDPLALTFGGRLGGCACLAADPPRVTRPGPC